MFGKNPIRQPDHADGLTLAVQSVFPTLQGEGPLAGTPAVFVRLGGCNLACSFCDTEFESFEELALDALVERIFAVRSHGEPLVVITGGEPLRQNITPLCKILLENAIDVQIETNGTLWRTDLPAAVQVVCSPKSSQGRYSALRPDLVTRLTALKYVVSCNPEHHAYHTIPDDAFNYQVPVYIQPMDEHNVAQNQANTLHAVKLCQQMGAHLSIQLHKLACID